MLWVVIIGAIILLFGAGRLPQLAKSIGQSRKAFKDGMREADEDEAVERSKIDAAVVTPQITQLSDEALMEEMKRRVEAKQA